MRAATSAWVSPACFLASRRRASIRRYTGVWIGFVFGGTDLTPLEGLSWLEHPCPLKASMVVGFGAQDGSPGGPPDGAGRQLLSRKAGVAARSMPRVSCFVWAGLLETRPGQPRTPAPDLNRRQASLGILELVAPSNDSLAEFRKIADAIPLFSCQSNRGGPLRRGISLGQLGGATKRWTPLGSCFWIDGAQRIAALACCSEEAPRFEPPAIVIPAEGHLPAAGLAELIIGCEVG